MVCPFCAGLGDPMLCDAHEAEILASRGGAISEIRTTILGLDAQLERIVGDDGFVTGYRMNTGLWHRILGIVATIDGAREGGRGEGEGAIYVCILCGWRSRLILPGESVAHACPVKAQTDALRAALEIARQWLDNEMICTGAQLAHLLDEALAGRDPRALLRPTGDQG